MNLLVCISIVVSSINTIDSLEKRENLVEQDTVSNKNTNDKKILSYVGMKYLREIYYTYESKRKQTPQQIKERLKTLNRELESLPRDKNTSFSFCVLTRSRDKPIYTLRSYNGFVKAFIDKKMKEKVFDIHSKLNDYKRNLSTTQEQLDTLKRFKREYTCYSYFKASLYHKFKPQKQSVRDQTLSKTFLN